MQIADLSDDDPLKFYLRELATVQPLASDEATGLLKQMRAGGDRGKYVEKRLIEANLSLVVAIAERFRSHWCPMLDLVQHGNEGLLLALKSFTGESNDDFSSYAARCIESPCFRKQFPSHNHRANKRGCKSIWVDPRLPGHGGLPS
jgi:DNA-directed RNA polymerase sigma subunit (sigma70/sigma32)